MEDRDTAPPAPASQLSRRLAGTAVLLVFLPLLVEAVTLDPIEVVHYRNPVFAALRVVLSNAIPYLTAALSVALIAVLFRARLDRPPSPVRPSVSVWLAVISIALALFAGLSDRSREDAMLAGEVTPRVRDGAVQLGRGGPLAPSVALNPVPLEEAEEFAARLVPSAPAPWTATVRWIGIRTSEEIPVGTRVELVGGGSVLDCTRDFGGLRLGEPVLFTKRLRVGPGTTRVRLRLAQDPLPPLVFFDAERGLEARGLTVEAGNGDRAFRAPPRVAPGAPASAPLVVEGEHVDGGYSVVVLSGEEWRRYDLRDLLKRGAELQLTLQGRGDVPWGLRLVGDGVESALVPFAGLRREDLGDSAVLALPLRALDWAGLAPGNVVGVALSYTGSPGAFRTEVRKARIALPVHQPSGFALAATSAFDPDAGPVDGFFAAGQPPAGAAGSFAFAWRLLAAAFAIMAAVGPRALAAVVATRPLAVPLAAFAGPLAAAFLPAVLLAFAEPRPEHMPIALGFLSVGLAGTARRPLRKPSETTESPVLAEPVAIPAWVHAFCGLAVLTAIGTHVTADASGQPFPYNSPDQRLPALLGRAVFTALDYPALILAFLLVLARLMTSGGTSARDVTRAFVRRLLAPFLFWSIAFLLIRHGKAFAFGYGEAYRGELASGLSWLRYALLGGAQYHLFLIPLFLVLGFISPVFRGASNRPALGALLPLTLALWPFLGGLAYDRIGSPDVRAYALFGAEAFAFLGYGFFAFMVAGKGFESLSRSKRAAVAWAASAVIAVGLALLVAHALREAEAGRWLPLSLPAHLGRYLVPAAALVLFRFCENVRFPAWFLRVGQLSFGIYLIHPAALDAMEILERGLALPPGLLAALNLAAVSLLSVLAVAALSRIPFLQFSVRPDRGGAR